jgi:hypothetical protein
VTGAAGRETYIVRSDPAVAGDSGGSHGLRVARKKFAEYFSTAHPIYRKLIKGTLAVSVVILERGGAILDGSTAEERSFLGEARRLERVMSR